MEVADRTPRPTTERRWWWLIAVITALGAVPRIIGSTESLAWDELYLYEWVHGHGLGAVMDVVQSKEKTPPLGFILAWAIDGFGGAPQTLRIPQLVAGIAIVPMVAMLALRVFTPGAGIVAALLAAASPMLVFYSSEARSYSMTTALALASTLLLIRCLDTGSRKAAVGYSLAAAAALMSHYTAVSVLFAQAVLAFMLWPRRRRLVIAAQAGPLLVTLAWLPGMLDQVRISSDELARIATVAPLSTSAVLEMTGRALAGNRLVPFERVPATAGWLLIAAGAGIAACFGLARLVTAAGGGRLRWPRHEVGIIAAGALAAPLLAIAVSAQPDQSMLLARNVIVSLPFALALAAGLIVLAPRHVAIASTALATAGLAAGTASSVTEAGRPAMRAAAHEVAERWKPGDRIVEICCRAGGKGPLGTGVAINLAREQRASLAVTSRTGYLPLTLPLPRGASIFVITYEPRSAAGGPIPGLAIQGGSGSAMRWIEPLPFEPPSGWNARFRPVAGGRFEGIVDTVWAQYRRRDESPQR